MYASWSSGHGSAFDPLNTLSLLHSWGSGSLLLDLSFRVSTWNLLLQVVLSSTSREVAGANNARDTELEQFRTGQVETAAEHVRKGIQICTTGCSYRLSGCW